MQLSSINTISPIKSSRIIKMLSSKQHFLSEYGILNYNSLSSCNILTKLHQSNLHINGILSAGLFINSIYIFTKTCCIPKNPYNYRKNHMHIYRTLYMYLQTSSKTLFSTELLIFSHPILKSVCLKIFTIKH